MNISEIMTVKPVTIHPANSISDALQRMRSVHCHHLPVLSSQSHLIGILSEYDCQQHLGQIQAEAVDRILDEQELAQKITVQEVMSAAPIVVEPDMTAHQAARLMLTNNIRSLPVMRAETLVGIVTTSDLLIAFMQMSDKYQDTMLRDSLVK